MSEEERQPEYLQPGGPVSNPGRLPLSRRLYRRLRGFGGLFWTILLRLFGKNVFKITEESIRFGDARAALVVSTSPLVVAAYTDELDCVVMLRFPDHLLRDHDLRAGTRLVAVFTYSQEEEMAPDLDPGPANTGNWSNAAPLIGEFLSEDRERLAELHAAIGEEEWERCRTLAEDYRKRHGGRAREGSLLFSGSPAK